MDKKSQNRGGSCAIAALPIGQLLLVILAGLIFLGAAQRVLDRMRLTDTQALLILGALFISPFLPAATVAPGININLAGVLIPLGIVVYLIATADQAYEKTRAVAAIILTAAVVFTTEQLLPAEPTQSIPVDIDPLWAAGIIAGVMGYLSGRSRRSSFIAGVGGVVLADLAGVVMATARGARGSFAAIGGAGAFDAIIIAGVLAVVLAEVVGETREYFARRRGAGLEANPSKDDGGKPDAEPSATNYTAVILSVGISILLLSGGTFLSNRIYGNLSASHQDNIHYRFFDEAGRLVNQSTWAPSIGDTWIDEFNQVYEVIDVDGHMAIAKTLSQLDLTGVDTVANSADPVPPNSDLTGKTVLAQAGGGLWERLKRSLGLGDGSRATGDKTILIIHTHNAESYVPTDGEAMTDGKGGIHKVGKVLAEELERRGFNVIHDESLHLPHDRGAYRRSRRTILSNFSHQPVAVLDIHRDAIPDPTFYGTEIDGKGVTKLRIVVGRQNPNRSQTLQFAKDLKAIADEIQPGFIMQIYNGKNNYNQDLGPRVILFEVGTHTNARESAERAMPILADVIERYFAQIAASN